MNIQVIQHNPNKKLTDEHITVSSLSEPRSLDEFEVNIIDLSSTSLWQTTNSLPNTILSMNDFHSLRTMAMNRKRSRIIYVYPTNCDFSFNYDVLDKRYRQKKKMKDNIVSLAEIISNILPSSVGNYRCLVYEKTQTTITDLVFGADFYYDRNYYGVIAKSDMSSKNVAVILDYDKKTFGTTLNITETKDHLLTFLNYIFPPKIIDEPAWMVSVSFLDDEEIKNEITKIDASLENLQNEKKRCLAKIDDNKKFKSILYSNGDFLAKIVCEILERILSCDLSEFIDVKKEDFRIIKDDVTFIGEIKGISTNVRNSNISQIGNHYDVYLESLEESENVFVKKLLIINPFRNKPLEEHEPIMDEQINKAEREECLVIETKVLLKIFEMFLRNEITTDRCIELFAHNSGVLSFEQVEEKRLIQE